MVGMVFSIVCFLFQREINLSQSVWIMRERQVFGLQKSLL